MYKNVLAPAYTLATRTKCTRCQKIIVIDATSFVYNFLTNNEGRLKPSDCCSGRYVTDNICQGQ